MTEDAFESQLFALETLLGRIAAGSGIPGDELGSDDAFNPSDTPPLGAVYPYRQSPVGGGDSLSEDDEQATLAAEALASCTRLIVSWKLRRSAFKTQPQAEALLRAEQQLGRVARTEVVDVTEVMENMPWLLQAALDTLLDDEDAIESDPAGGPATVARILASMLDIIESSERPQPVPCDATHAPAVTVGGPFASRRRH